MSTAERLRTLSDDNPSAPLALVVEDDPDAAELAALMLKLCGFRARHAGTANDALLAAAEERPALILLDICLPDMNGVGFLRVASKMPGFRKVKILAASALHPANGPIGTQLKRMGVRHYLDKPYRVGDMRRELELIFPRMQAKSPKTSLEDLEGLSLPAEVVCFGETREVRLLAATPDALLLRGQKLPVGNSITVRLKHEQLVFDEYETFDLVAMATVVSSVDDPAGALSRLSVVVSRPPLEFDRMCDELPDP
jgi:CheY-like chemotaxis protein